MSKTGEITVYKSKNWSEVFWEWINYIVSTMNDHPLTGAPLNIFVLSLIRNILERLPYQMSINTLNLATSLIWSTYNTVFSKYSIGLPQLTRLFLITYTNLFTVGHIYNNVLPDRYQLGIMRFVASTRFISLIGVQNIESVVAATSSMFIANAIEKQPLAIEYKTTISRFNDLVSWVKQELAYTTWSVLLATSFYSKIYESLRTNPTIVIPPRGTRNRNGQYVTNVEAADTERIRDSLRRAMAKHCVTFGEALTITAIENILHIINFKGKSIVTERPAIALLDALEYWAIRHLTCDMDSKFRNIAMTVLLKLGLELVLYEIGIEPNLVTVMNA